MAYIRHVKVKGHIYYRVVESYRDNCGHVKQRVIQHIGKRPAGFQQETMEKRDKFLKALSCNPLILMENKYNIKKVLAEYDRREAANQGK